MPSHTALFASTWLVAYASRTCVHEKTAAGAYCMLLATGLTLIRRLADDSHLSALCCHEIPLSQINEEAVSLMMALPSVRPRLTADCFRFLVKHQPPVERLTIRSFRGTPLALPQPCSRSDGFAEVYQL